ncbi:hypothetical protein J2741_002473 [Methanolinea mesophila]|uniref:hypothetical protein n=1 Tax=Methanolinea mesophila TaxID=547055 RepID=UPI001AE13AF3|nr:hypothetical protein [Methanolinea mesophila]MBP1929877.1 hypothetical protein [Methanolinea mesophila]
MNVSPIVACVSVRASGKIIIGAIILALFLFSILYGPSYIDSANRPERGTGWTFELNESQIKIANEMWGSDITVGEFYQKVCPEYLATMPEELEDYLFTTRMEWP